MTYDCFTFNGEYDLLEIRFNLLSPFVDKFIIVEGWDTFSGNPKPLYWIERDLERFEEWEQKVVYCVVMNYDDPQILAQIEARKDYVDEPAFQKAFYQKETIRRVLEGLKPNDEDVIFYGDADEIWRPPATKDDFVFLDDKTYKLRQLAYSYYLNNRSPEDWRGTIVTKWKNLKDGCLNDLRAKPEHILEQGGWHWTNLGGLEAIKLKLESYDHQEANIPAVKDTLAEKLTFNVDFLGRGFQFWEDDSDLPAYLLENKAKYYKLWKS